jgi:hypothetical protein
VTEPTTYDIEYQAIGAIRVMLDTAIHESETRLWLERRTDPPNPYYNQTAAGLYLELYYGMPNRLWTPWGQHHLGGSGSGRWDDVAAMLVKRLGGALYRERKYEPSIGAIGEVYALCEVDGSPLPVASLRPREAFVDYHDCKRSWNDHVIRLGTHRAEVHPH